MALKAFADVAAALAWPSVVLIIAYLFRSAITALVSRVRQIKATGVELVLQQLEQQGQLPIGARSELQGLSAHDIWALDSFAEKKVPLKPALMNNMQRVAARTLVDAGLLTLKGERRGSGG